MLFIVACQDDDYVAPDKLSDVTWYTSVNPGDSFLRAIEDHISFLDASQGVISHEWTIEEGNYFLKTGFNDRDSLPNFIDSSKGLVTDDETVHVLFMKEGINTVCLKNTFEEQVTFQGEDGPIESTQVGDKWVFEKCFEVDVLAKEIKPAFRVLQDGIEVLSVSADDEIDIADSGTWPVIDVEVNKTLTFIDESTVGRPNDRLWRINGGTPETSNEVTAEIAFLNFGTTTTLGRIESNRIDPLPNKTNWKQIPLKVRVISSSEPFEILGGITENESEVLSFQVAGIVDTASIIGKGANFTVNVVNSSGFNQDIAVQSISLNSNNESIIELTLAEPIYNSDVITVSYSGGSIQSTDERQLDDFSNIEVDMFFEDNAVADSFERFSFETYNDEGVGRGDALGWWAQHMFYQRTDEQAASGLYSYKFSHPDFATAGGGMTSHGASDLAIPAGNYKMIIKIFMESGSSIGGVRTNLTPWKLLVWDLNGIAKGEWVTLDRVVTTDAITTKVLIQVHTGESPGLTGPQTMYIDDIQFVPLELRP